MLETQLKLLAEELAKDYKAIIALIGNLNSLPADVTKTSIVAALNSLNSKIANAAGINDAATATGSTWSSTKITASIKAAVDALVDGAPAALDTLKELAAQMAADEGVLNSVVTALGNRVSVNDVQTFTAAQKKQARDNISAVSTDDLGNPSVDLVTYYNSKKAA